MLLNTSRDELSKVEASLTEVEDSSKSESIRITVGKLAGEGKVEYKLRREDTHEVMTAEEAIAKAKALVDLEGDGRYFFSRLSEETMNAH